MLVLLLFFSHFSDSDLSLLSHVGKCHDQFFFYLTNLQNCLMENSKLKFIHNKNWTLSTALNQLTSLIYLLNSQISLFNFFCSSLTTIKKMPKKSINLCVSATSGNCWACQSNAVGNNHFLNFDTFTYSLFLDHALNSLI